MHTTAEEATAAVGTGRLWYGLLVGAAAWKLQLMINYGLVPYACWHDLSPLIHLASLSTMLVAVSAAWVAWGSWKRVGEGKDTAVGGPVGRSRFMAVSGIVASGYFALLILGQWLPNLLLSPCDGIS